MHDIIAWHSTVLELETQIWVQTPLSCPDNNLFNALQEGNLQASHWWSRQHIDISLLNENRTPTVPPLQTFPFLSLQHVLCTLKEMLKSMDDPIWCVTIRVVYAKEISNTPRLRIAQERPDFCMLDVSWAVSGLAENVNVKLYPCHNH